MPKKLRPFRYEGNLAYVPLSQGLESVIDAADAHLVGHKNWYAHWQGQAFYAVAKQRLSSGKEIMVMLHRMILAPVDKPLVDHIDGDSLNNRRSNLRAVTHSQNVYNSRASAFSLSGYKGVSFLKREGRWKASIKIGGKEKHIGQYATPEEAARAYDAVTAKVHGAFARLNFPEAHPRPSKETDRG